MKMKSGVNQLQERKVVDSGKSEGREKREGK